MIMMAGMLGGLVAGVVVEVRAECGESGGRNAFQLRASERPCQWSVE
jgi:hypothetical protein